MAVVGTVIVALATFVLLIMWSYDPAFFREAAGGVLPAVAIACSLLSLGCAAAWKRYRDSDSPDLEVERQHDTIHIDRDDMPELELGRSAVTIVFETVQQETSGERREREGYGIWWMANDADSIENEDLPGSYPDRFERDNSLDAPDGVTVVLPFSSDRYAAREFAEALCKVGGADLVWTGLDSQEARWFERRALDFLDEPIARRLERLGYPDLPERGELNLEVPSDDDSTLIWRPDMSRSQLSRRGCVSTFLLMIAMPVFFMVGLVLDVRYLALYAAGVFVAVLVGLALWRALSTYRVNISPDRLHIDNDFRGLVPVSRDISLEQVETIDLDEQSDDFVQLVLVGDDLVQPIGYWTARDRAERLRAIFYHAIAGSDELRRKAGEWVPTPEKEKGEEDEPTDEAT